MLNLKMREAPAEASTMTTSIADAILRGAEVLRKAGVPGARREAGSLLSHVLGKDRTFLISHAENLIADGQMNEFRECVERRAQGEPIQYITGSQDFFGLEFKVTPDVLIPRPETELLVEIALKLIDDEDTDPQICDVGTGSGCIAITLLRQRPLAHSIALDVSEAAIRIAKENASRHSVNDRISFVVSDCFQSLAEVPPFDLIVSNPPYVSAEALDGLQREVRDHEPRVALSPGLDGLSVIRRLLQEAADFLKSDGYLLIEIGFDQAAAVEGLIDADVWRLLEIYPDLQGIHRIVALQKIHP
jgi:release factor glutamine methyltransferase